MSKIVKFKTVTEVAMAIQQELEKAEDAILLASKIYVSYIDDEKAKVRELKELLGFSYETYVSMERIGRGIMDQRLIFTETKARKKLAAAPKSQQKKALDKGLEVLVDNGEVLRVKIDDLTSNQIKQVFAGDHVRSIAEQKNYIRNRKAQMEFAAKLNIPKVEKEPEKILPIYEIKKGKLIINKPTELSRKEVFDILSKLV